VKTVTGFAQLIPIILCGVLYSNVSFAQLDQPNRYELEREYSDEDLSIISLKNEGLALIRTTNKYKSGKRTWEVVMLDTTLQETSKQEFEIDTQNRLIGHDHSQGAVHFLFFKNELKGYMDLISLNIKNKNIVRYEIKPELTFQLTHFFKVGENFLFGGVVSREPAILLFNTSSDNLKVIPGFFQKQAELLDVQVNKNQTFNTLVIDRSNREDQKVIFKTHDSFGKLLLEDVTSIETDIEIHSGISSTLEREELLVLGSWGKLNAKQASGFYALPINPFIEKKINKNYFGQLDHYLDYLKPKKASSIRSKTNTALKEGRIPDFTNHIIPYKIIENDQGFLLLAESFQSTSNPQSSRTSYDPHYYPYYTSPRGFESTYPTGPSTYNRMRTYNRNVINEEEIKPIQMVVVSFEGSGSILWDYSVKLKDIKTNIIEQVADFQIDTDSIRFLYKKESELRIKSINLDDSESVEKTYKIKLRDMIDELRMERSQEGSVKHWYDKSFYVWGYQTIRNRAKGEFKTREVFYINKILVR
jgi:hypothetical protein